jgi:hypothetical protein
MNLALLSPLTERKQLAATVFGNLIDKRPKKFNEIFDIDWQTFLILKTVFPENQTGKSSNQVRLRNKKYGISITEFIHQIGKYVELTPEKELKIQKNLDRMDFNIVTWREFQNYF